MEGEEEGEEVGVRGRGEGGERERGEVKGGKRVRRRRERGSIGEEGRRGRRVGRGGGSKRRRRGEGFREREERERRRGEREGERSSRREVEGRGGGRRERREKEGEGEGVVGRRGGRGRSRREEKRGRRVRMRRSERGGEEEEVGEEGGEEEREGGGRKRGGGGRGSRGGMERERGGGRRWGERGEGWMVGGRGRGSKRRGENGGRKGVEGRKGGGRGGGGRGGGEGREGRKGMGEKGEEGVEGGEGDRVGGSRGKGRGKKREGRGEGNDWKRILHDAPIYEAECFDPGGDNDDIDAFLAIEVPMYIEEGYYDSEGDVIYLESLLSDDTTHNLSPEVFFDHEPQRDTFSPKSDPLHHEFTSDLITIPPGISLPTSTTLVEDSDSNREKIDIFSGPDDSIPPGIESDFDLEEDIIDNLLNDDPIPEYERLTFDMEPNVLVINNVNEDKCFDLGGGEINVEVDDSFTIVTQTFLLYLTYPEVSPLLSSTENKDTIPDPDIST
ncbi:hypothetical protein Tco_0111297 [Tanacetum coccineum]